jgi:RNA polymerase sigma-70 factor (ECF subfamily)
MLDKCIEKLPAKYREPLILYYFEEMNYREIADVMHLPVSTVGVRLQRGKVLLKKGVKDNGGA